MGTCPLLEIGSKNEKILENLKLAAKFWLIHLIVATTVYLPVWHCTRARFTVLMSYSDEIAVRSCPLLCLQMQVAKLASRLLYCWSLLRNNWLAMNIKMFTSSCGSRRSSACDQFSHCVFSTQICFFGRPGCLGLIMKNRVKSVFQVINSLDTSMCWII